jgi:hypothetical protein
VPNVETVSDLVVVNVSKIIKGALHVLDAIFRKLAILVYYFVGANVLGDSVHAQNVTGINVGLKQYAANVI